MNVSAYRIKNKQLVLLSLRHMSSAVTPSDAVDAFDPKYRQLSIKLDKLAPRFDLPAGSVRILLDPKDFYDTLRQKIGQAERRIFLSTLYVGKTEYALIDTIRERLISRPDLKISILTDALRGTRESPKASCASLLAPLISEFGSERVEVSMYHTPNLHGIRKRIISRRFDEGWGLQHMKLYGVDDEIMLSGANLSNDYFTDRQDRYQLFSSPDLTRFYERLHDAVSSISYKVLPNSSSAGYALRWEAKSCPEPTTHPKEFRRYTSRLIKDVIVARPLDHCEFTTENPPATIIYPLVQMTPLLEDSSSTEQPAVNLVLDMLAQIDHKDTKWHFTAGYFNVFDEYRSRLLKALGQGTVITASPDANGFYKSPGPSGMLAAAYTLLSKRFLDEARAVGKQQDICLKEWKRGTYGEPNRWTYHAKGLWIHPTSSESQGPSLTFIGSSNLTKRSQNLDLEATAIMITSDKALQKELAKEIENLQKYARKVEVEELNKKERQADLQTRIALWLCQGML